MTNLHELERRWRRYKLRRMRPYFFLFILAAALVSALIWYLQQPTPLIPALQVQSKPEESPKPTLTAMALKVPEANTTMQDANTSTPLPPVAAELKPSFDFLRAIDPSDTTQRKPNTGVQAAPSKTPATPPKKRLQPAQDLQRVSTQRLSMESSSKEQKMDSLIARFKNSKNPNLGIVIVKYYYDKEAFKEAYSYALEVNAVDKRNEASWLFAAKSLYRLERIPEAVALLKSYIAISKSHNAHKLLLAIEQGRVE